LLGLFKILSIVKPLDTRPEDVTLGSSGLERTVNGIENLGAQTIAVMVTDAIVYKIGST